MDEMKAGRELDIEILVRVFKFPRKKIFDDYGCLMYIPSGKPKRTHMIDAQPVPKFSTSITAAWLLVDKFGLSVIKSEDGWYTIKPTDIWHERMSCTDKNSIRLIGRDGEIFQAADTPMLAICRAALLAIGHAQEKDGA